MKAAPPWRPARPGELNYNFADRWTLIHLLAGVGFSTLGVTPIGMLGLALSWEFIVEPILKRAVPETFFPATQDTLANSMGDVAANVVGNYLGHKLLGGIRARSKSA